LITEHKVPCYVVFTTESGEIKWRCGMRFCLSKNAFGFYWIGGYRFISRSGRRVSWHDIIRHSLSLEANFGMFMHLVLFPPSSFQLIICLMYCGRYRLSEEFFLHPSSGRHIISHAIFWK
jgi:hypothetical protein